MMIYVIGSLRNPKITSIGNALRSAGHDAFDQWFASGPEADDYWQKYCKERGWTYREALASVYAEHIFEFDRHHLESCDAAVQVMPSGKSGCWELGYVAGKGKPTFILIEEEPERYDVMARFATIVSSVNELIHRLNPYQVLKTQEYIELMRNCP